MFFNFSFDEYLLCRITKNFDSSTKYLTLAPSLGLVFFQKHKTMDDTDDVETKGLYGHETQYWLICGSPDPGEFLVRNYWNGYFLSRVDDKFVVTKDNTMFTWTMEELEDMLKKIAGEHSEDHTYMLHVQETIADAKSFDERYNKM